MFFKNNLASALEQFEIIRLFGSLGSFTSLVFFLNILAIIAFLIMPHVGSLSNDAVVFTLYKNFNFVRGLLKTNLQGSSRTYFYYISTLFLFILFSNVLGLLPYSLTVTSYLVLTLFLSGTTFFGSLLVGLQRHSFRFFSFFIPAGTPLVLKPFLVLIEIISYVSRVLSLSIRLFANMLAGHALLKILCGFVFLFISAGSS